jgi:ABC-type microcin C transport system duplicated ATPase subunit YejF
VTSGQGSNPGSVPGFAPLLTIDKLQVHFPIKAGILRRRVGWVRAVDGVSLTVHEARPSASSASPAAARRRRAAP